MRPKAAFQFDIEKNLTALPANAVLNIYCIIQEGLTNAVRHGRPSAVKVSLRRSRESKESVSLVIEDDGGGNPDFIANASGFGILGIRERVAALGGRLDIGRAERSVRISASIPVAPLPLGQIA